MLRIRTYCNSDSPALAELWSTFTPPHNTVRPLGVHAFDSLVPGKLSFDHQGLIVAEADGRIVGFAHAGFGPCEPLGPSHSLDHKLGTIAMLVVENGSHADDACNGLIAEAINYLKCRGAQVIYAGGMSPLTPFYWGLYGGSEFSGVLGSHTQFHEAVRRAGFEAVSTTLLFEAPLDRPEPRDMRFAPVRRQYRVEIEEDTLLTSWWTALHIGEFHPTRLEMVDRQNGLCRARALTWEIAQGGDDPRMRTALLELEVDRDFRNRGLGRTLVAECFRHAREQRGDILCVQTLTTNEPAVRLYQSLGFEQVEHATLYRLPAGQ